MPNSSPARPPPTITMFGDAMQRRWYVLDALDTVPSALRFGRNLSGNLVRLRRSRQGLGFEVFYNATIHVQNGRRNTSSGDICTRYLAADVQQSRCARWSG